MKLAHIPVCDWVNCTATPDVEVQTDDGWQPMCAQHARMWIDVCRASADAEGKKLGEVSPRPLTTRH